ncbi:MAG TPA: sulfatase-like hydrolase/transferase [Thermoanaerobaculia bacterium]|nr:sulfatase-like hydrolase/transferase [Thermoanaerobaculia bacterium]
MKRALHFCFLLFAFCFACKREQPKYNVLLITLDTFRADRIGPLTPNLTRLANEGVRFDNAESAVPLTLPSHSTILSGMLPLHHGVRNNGAGSFPADRPTLATLLSSNGYRTAAFIGAFVLDHRFGLNRGFDVYDDEIPRDPTLGDHLEAERRGDAVVDRALAWLGQGDARPYFAWVHLYDAHAPYVPSYDGEIAFVDQQVQRLLGAVDRANTIIVIAGDHGEALGEHGELTHGLLLYEPSLRVPMILAAPGLDPQVVKTPVSLTDIAPTVAALCGAAGFSPPDGRDLTPSLRDKKEPPPADVYAETEYPTVFGWSGLSALRRGNHKYISSPAPELYDLAGDPRESKNIYSEDRRTMRALSTALASLTTTASKPAPSTTPDAETMAKLASLGYVGGMPASRSGPKPDPKIMVPLFRKFEEATWATTAKNYDTAGPLLEDIVQRDPENPVFRMSLAKVERLRGRPQRAIELFRDAIAFAPNDAQAWYNLAAAFQEAGDLRHAGEAVREALRRDDKNADAHNVLGIINSAEGKPMLALGEFQKAVAIDPRNARVHNNIGNAARAMGRNDDAEAAFRRAIALAPNYPDPFNGLGALNVDRNRFADAVANFDRALQLAPEYHEARLNRAVALQLGGNLDAAATEYRNFIARSANDPAFARQREAAKGMLAQLRR